MQDVRVQSHYRDWFTVQHQISLLDTVTGTLDRRVVRYQAISRFSYTPQSNCVYVLSFTYRAMTGRLCPCWIGDFCCAIIHFDQSVESVVSRKGEYWAFLQPAPVDLIINNLLCFVPVEEKPQAARLTLCSSSRGIFVVAVASLCSNIFKEISCVGFVVTPWPTDAHAVSQPAFSPWAWRFGSWKENSWPHIHPAAAPVSGVTRPDSFRVRCDAIHPALLNKTCSSLSVD